MKGTIARLTDRGFGFITPAEGGDKDLFFHARSLVEGLEYDSLREGDAVTYDVEEGQKGPAAINVAKAEGGEAPAADDAAADADAA